MSEQIEKFTLSERDRFPGEVNPIGYVCVYAKLDGKWIFCLHHRRKTWECPGGHVENGESAADAARRELWEETGATEYTLYHCWDYEIQNDNGTSGGAVFYAEVKKLGELPAHEMDSLLFTDSAPENTTYNRDRVNDNLHRVELFLRDVGGIRV